MLWNAKEAMSSKYYGYDLSYMLLYIFLVFFFLEKLECHLNFFLLHFVLKLVIFVGEIDI